jgi:hypothetical protein
MRAMTNTLQETEICIPSYQLSTAEMALKSSRLFERLPPCTPNLYTAYKKDSPRFLHIEGHQTPITLLGSQEIGFENLQVLGRAEHAEEAFYSGEIRDYLSVDDIKQIPIPALPSFVQYLCVLFFSSGDEMYRIRLEQLVDGMNIDEAWCTKNLTDEGHMQYLLNLVNSKTDRIDDFSGHLVTCYIADQELAESITRIPGY